MAIMRSWDWLIKISAGPSPGYRSGTASRRTRIPVPPPAASSAVAQATPVGAKVLDRGDHAGRVQLKAALDQQLLHERVAHLHVRVLRPLAVGVGAIGPERGAGQHRGAADAAGPVREPRRTTWLPGPGAAAELQIGVPHDAHARDVDQRVARIAGVERQLTADIRQAQAVAVERDPPTTPGSTRRVSAASAGPNRSESSTATGRAPIARMSRTIPPTPVAAPWNGST